MVSNIDSMPHRFRGAFDGNKGRAFVAMAVFVSFVSFVAFSGGNRGYEANLSVLVMPGTMSSSVSKDVIENIVLLSRTTEFRTMFFQDAESVPGLMVTEDVSDMSGDMMKKSFDSMVTITPTGTGSMIMVRAYAENQDDAKNIARTSALALFRFASRYYDVEREVDFRIIDGPSVAASLPNRFLLIFGSAAVGIAVTGILFVFYVSAKRDFMSFDRRKMPLPNNPFGAEMFQPKRPVASLLSESISEESSDHVNEARIHSVEASVLETEDVPVNDTFFEPEPAKRVNVSDQGASVDVKNPIFPMPKQAPAPLDIPTYSEEEEQFLKEFTFEEFEDGSTAHEERADRVVESQAVVPTTAEEAPAATTTVAGVPTTEELLSKEPHSAPTKSDYQRRLNELLRG
jgi:capsular polysaccharide biosynthesis protein